MGGCVCLSEKISGFSEVSYSLFPVNMGLSSLLSSPLYNLSLIKRLLYIGPGTLNSFIQPGCENVSSQC